MANDERGPGCRRPARRFGAAGMAAAGRVAAAMITAGALLAGCAAEPDAPAPVPPPPPPPPPAACLLDVAALATGTGLSWRVDPSTASDTRCVYDPAGGDSAAGGPAFVAVDIAQAPGQDAATELDTVAELCEDATRAPAGDAGFVCRFQGGSVFAATVRGGEVVTVSASAVPPGATADQLAAAFDEQLRALR